MACHNSLHKRTHRPHSTQLLLRNGECASFSDFITDDLPGLEAACEAQAAEYRKLADALERDDRKELHRAQTAAAELSKAIEVWRYRIGELRKRQAERTDHESGHVITWRWAGPHAPKECAAMVRAKRDSAMAWGDLAEATTPGADQQRLVELEDKAYAADAHAEIADWRLRWALRRVDIRQGSRADSEEMDRALAAWQRLEDERVQIRLADVERDRHLRGLNRRMRQADQEYVKAHDAAKVARERAARGR